MQWRKLFDFNPIYATLSDKNLVRRFIASRIGPDHLPEKLWYGFDVADLPLDELEPPYFIKSSHGSQSFRSVETRPDAAEATAIRAEAADWLKINHGLLADEPGYLGVRPGIIVERAIQNHDGSKPMEIKAFVFSGRIEVMSAVEVEPVSLKRRWTHFTRDWKPHAWTPDPDSAAEEPPPPPPDLERLVFLIETVAAGFDHLRVDTYASEGRILFGELTVYSQSGLTPINPLGVDKALGSVWRGDFTLSRGARALLRGPREAQVSTRVERRPTSRPNDPLSRR